MTLIPGDDVLTLRDGQLYVEGVNTGRLADEFGTPLYVMSELQLRTNARRWAGALADAWPDGETLILPSLKANTSPTLRAILNDEGVGCDVFGSAELEVALHSDVAPDRISLNGATKSDALLRRAIGAGVTVTLDSAGEFERLRVAARGLGSVARVRFRLRPWLPQVTSASDFDPAAGPAYLSVQEYRAGMPGEDLVGCLRTALVDPYVDPVGVHAHATRQTVDLGFWRAYACFVAETCGELSRRCPGWRLREIDLGGGFAVPRDPTGHSYAEYARLAPTPQEYVVALTDGLRDGLRRCGLAPDGVALQIEPGRAVYGNAGIHLARVLNVKRQNEPLPRSWIETDTSEAFLADTIVEHNRWTVVLADAPDRPRTLEAAITGISCGFEMLVAPSPQPEVVPGELLAFLDAGAYQDATASNFNLLCRPATVLVSGVEARIIKRRETLADVMTRDLPVGVRST